MDFEPTADRMAEAVTAADAVVDTFFGDVPPTNVHDLQEHQHRQELERKAAMIEALDRRQHGRRLFLSEISHMIERRQLEIDNLKAALSNEMRGLTG